MVVFAAIFAVLLLASLLVAERLAPKGPSLDAEDEFVKRYQEVIGPYSRWLRAAVVVVLSLIVGSQAIGQWNNWILFRNSTPFHATDPQFHRNVAYFVFTLPFEQFLVHWALVALFLVLLVTVLSHYLNGGIRMQGSRPAGPPGGQGPHLGHPRTAGPGQGGRLLPGPVQPRPLAATATSRAPATPTCTPGCPPSNCSSWCRWPPPSCSSTTSGARVGRCPSSGSGCGSWWP